MIRIFRRFFDFCGEINKRKFTKSIFLGVLKALFEALKIPAIAPEAPQPIRSMSVLWSTLKSRPKLEPIAEPVRTIGDSAPTDPPNPMVMPLAITLDQQLWRRICPCRRDMAYRILVTPCPMSSLTTYFMNKAVRKIPTTGYTRKSQFDPVASKPAVSKEAIQDINCLSR